MFSRLREQSNILNAYARIVNSFLICKRNIFYFMYFILMFTIYLYKN